MKSESGEFGRRAPATGGHFDLDKVRKNWERADAPAPASLDARFAAVRAPHDPYEAARGLLSRIRSQALQRFPAHVVSIEPFFTQAEDLLMKMETRPDGDDAANAASGDPRRDFEQLLWDLEDLFEVFAGIGR